MLVGVKRDSSSSGARMREALETWLEKCHALTIGGGVPWLTG